jgi:hypothetical protein
MKGKGVHGGTEVNMRQKIESRVDLPEADVVDAAVSVFEGEVAGGFMLTPDEAQRKPSIVLGEAKDAVVSMARAHVREQAPDYQPVAVEHTVRIELPDSPRDVLTVIDLVDEQRRIVDFKTSVRARSVKDADESVQLSLYAVAYQREFGVPAEDVRFDTLVPKKDGSVNRVVVGSRRDVHDFRALAARINAVNKAIDAGVFTPASPGSWWCSPKWCGYWSTCEFVNAQLVQLEE